MITVSIQTDERATVDVFTQLRFIPGVTALSHLLVSIEILVDVGEVAS